MTKLEAIQAVLAALEVYQGEPVLKNEHPLWHAVVALEKHCRPPKKYVPQWRLPTPAHSQWCRLLWASRPDAANYQPGEWMSPRIAEPCNPELALTWAKLLKIQILNMLEYEHTRIPTTT